MSQSEPIRRQTLRHVWHPCTELNAFEASEFPVIVRGEGVCLYDADGRRYLDGIASWWCVNLGHNHPRLVEAIQRQAGILQHCILGGMTHPNVAELAARLATIAPPGLQHSFFCGDGSSAVEAALKIALQHWANLGQRHRTEFIGLEEGYHGDTLGAIGVGFVEAFHRDYASAVRPAHRACSPHCLQCPFGKLPDSCAVECFASMERIVAERGDRIAAVIVEPLCQGAAGMRIYPVKYLRKLRALCDRHQILLIADEIAVGFGRTGAMFACGLAGITPDLMTIGKGLTGGYMPMSAVMATAPIFESFRNGGDGHDRTFYHSHTYGGNPITSALALAALDVYTEERVLERMAPRIEQLRAGFQRLGAMLGDSRWSTLGMIGVVEVGDQAGGAARARAIGVEARARGLLLRPRARGVYLYPPLTTTEAELGEMLAIIEQAIAATGP